MTLNTIFESSAHKIESAGVQYTDNRQAYQSGASVVTVNGSPAVLTLSGDYVAEAGDLVEISTTIIGGEAITYPGAILKMPVVRHADGMPTDDEIYFNATIIAGVMTATGSLPRSGNWQCLVARINRALERTGADWKLSGEDVSIVV